MRLGIVGLGTIGRAICLAIDRGDVKAQLVAVTTRQQDGAQAFLKELQHPPALLSLDDLI